MPTKRITFAGSQGHELAARLELPDSDEPKAYALFAHCFTCSKNFKAPTHISHALAKEGFGVLRFDFTGLGESEGDFADTNFSSNVQDLIKAAEYLGEEHQAPKIVIGHSLGGAAILQAATKLGKVDAVVTIGAPYDPGHVKHLLGDAVEKLKTEETAQVTIAGRTFSIQRQFVEDLEEQEMKETIGGLRRALLVLHAPLDATVGVDNAALIFQAAKHPKSFVSLDTADHLLSNEDDARYAGALIAVWSSRYL